MVAEAAFLGVLSAKGTRIAAARTTWSSGTTRASSGSARRVPCRRRSCWAPAGCWSRWSSGETASSTVGRAGLPASCAPTARFDRRRRGCRPMLGHLAEPGRHGVPRPRRGSTATCAPGVDAQEQHVVAVLGSGFRAGVDDDRLTVTGPDGHARSTAWRDDGTAPVQGPGLSVVREWHGPAAGSRRELARASGQRGSFYSHSMVPGGLLVTSRTTRLTSATSLVMRVEILASRS